jgi:hypothetical protein
MLLIRQDWGILLSCTILEKKRTKTPFLEFKGSNPSLLHTKGFSPQA